MPAVTAALSVSEQINQIGAYAGLASILGLAVLSLLYFGQARELKRLRDWAGRAPEKTAELQEQANQAAAAAAQKPPAPTPQAAPARPVAQAPATAAGGAARPAAGAGSVKVLPGAPPTVAAPPPAVAATATPAPTATAKGPSTAAGAAAAAATASTAAGASGPPAASPGTTAPPGQGPAAGAAPGAGAGGATTAPGGPPAADGAAPAPAGSAPPPPTTTGGPISWAEQEANGSTSVGQQTEALPVVSAPLPPASPSVAAPAPIGPEGPPTDDNPVALRQVSPAGAAGQPRRRPVPEPVRPEPPRRGRRLGLIAGSLAALVLAVVLATQMLGGGDGTPSNVSTSDTDLFAEPAGSTGGSTTAPAVTNGDYAVYVLNGTQQNGIAAEFAKRLEQEGFRSAGTGNAAVNTAPTTQVYYVEGKKAGATAVARDLKVAAANVLPADQAVSVQGPGADVIVQIGADKATP